MEHTRNSILLALSDADSALLAPHLQLVELPREQRLERRGRVADHVYFIERGVACATAGDGGVEVGMIGREGVVGVPTLLGAQLSPYDVQMITPGTARRTSVAAIRDAMNQSPSFRNAIGQYVLKLLLQVMREAQSNARATLDARVVRWLLMMHDRVDGDELHLTHERLAALLGVRRAGVSVAAKKLERTGVIALHRGAIVVRDRKRLEDGSAGAYITGDWETSETRR